MSYGNLPRVHGGTAALASEDGAKGAVLDMSTCVDAFGLFDPVIQALHRVDHAAAFRNYPDPESRLARGRLAEFAGVHVECIDVAPGAAELIWTLTRAVLRPNELALLWKPCFSEIEHAISAVSARQSAHWFAGESLEREITRFFDAVAKQRPTLAYLCAPTCPRGQWIPSELLRRGTQEAPDTTFVIDQSYLNLSSHATELATRFPDNVVLLRSITKELGLPGVRVGYAVMNARLRGQLQSQRAFWSVGAHAQAVLEAYVECQPLLTLRRESLLAHAKDLGQALRDIGLSPEPSDTHYFTVDVSREGTSKASGVALSLLRKGVAVRDCASFGLPDHVRLVAHPEQQRLVTALSELVATNERGVSQ
jgi:histidinol-phosphate/aromatic aminotransferase/cobyric acid decarboxylase-like protein